MRDGLPALALKLFHVAWMSVGLGIALELLAIVILLLSGGSSTALGVAANVLSRVSWSVVVCAALAVTTSLSRLSIPFSGVAGLLVAPSMTLITKSLQKMILTMLAGAQGGPAFGVLLTFAAIKGAEALTQTTATASSSHGPTSTEKRLATSPVVSSWLSPKASATSITASTAIPAQSKERVASMRRPGNRRQAIAMTTSASGTLSQKIDCQP